MDRPTRALAISACLSECAWDATGDELDGERLFACRSCGSEWVRSQSWTPADWQGQVPDAVRREREDGAPTR
ncbi:MAG: hypothetical protein M3Z83_05850 [Actinomycetota bacterium]|nr:hypothetical protein [Actinomycetota bacterium]